MAKKKIIDKRDIQKKNSHPIVAPRLKTEVKKNTTRPGSKPVSKGKAKKK